MKHKTPKAQLKELACEVYRQAIRGVPLRDIGKVKGLKQKQVYYLWEQGARILGGELDLLIKRGLLREFLAQAQEVRSELWTMYYRAKQEAVKLGALVKVMDNTERMLDLAERLKLIEQKAEQQRVQVEHRINYDEPTLRTRLEDLQLRLS